MADIITNRKATMETKFISSKDFALLTVVWGSALLLFGLSTKSILSGLTALTLLVGILTFGTACILVWIAHGTYYTISKTHLVAHSGPFRYRISIQDIVEIQASNNSISSPAMSMKRLKI